MHVKLFHGVKMGIDETVGNKVSVLPIYLCVAYLEYNNTLWILLTIFVQAHTFMCVSMYMWPLKETLSTCIAPVKVCAINVFHAQLLTLIKC